MKPKKMAKTASDAKARKAAEANPKAPATPKGRIPTRPVKKGKVSA